MVQFLKVLIVLVNNALMLVKGDQSDWIRSANLHISLHRVYKYFWIVGRNITESKIEQTQNAIIHTIINGIWKSIVTQTFDTDGKIHIIHEVFKNEELQERTERIIEI